MSANKSLAVGKASGAGASHGGRDSQRGGRLAGKTAELGCERE
jgi:hypothetical protein